MNADVALPWAKECVMTLGLSDSPFHLTLLAFFFSSYSQQGQIYDPIFYASTQHQNAEPLTIFSQRGLALVAVPWLWDISEDRK